MTNKEEDDSPPTPTITTRVIQIANIAAQTTRDQMQTLFGYVGKMEDIRLYPTSRDMTGMPIQTRICYVKYISERSLPVALQLNNTIYIDRALIVTPWLDGDIPDETLAVEMAAAGIPGLLDPKLPNHLVNQIQGVPPNTLLFTHDPNITSNGLPPYPVLPARTDGRTVEETRRTLTLVDIDPDVTHQQVFDFFKQVGSEVAYFRRCKAADEDEPHYALIEFGKQEDIINALKLNGQMLGSKEAKIAHSKINIQKPQMKTHDVVQKEIEEAMKLAKESSSLFSALDGEKKRSRSRSLSRGRHRRSSRSRSRRRSTSRRRSRSKRRSRSRSRDRRRRSRSRDRRSRSRDRRRRSRTRSRDRKRARSPRRSTSRSRARRDKEKRSRDRESVKKEKDVTPPETKEVKSEKRSSSRRSSRSPSRKKSRSPSRKKSRSPSKRRSKTPVRRRSRSPKKESRKKSRSPIRRKSRSPVKRRSRTPVRKRSRSRDRDRERDRRRRPSRSPGRRRVSRSPRRRPSTDRKLSRTPKRDEGRKPERREGKREERDMDIDEKRKDSPISKKVETRQEEDMDMDTSTTP